MSDTQQFRLRRSLFHWTKAYHAPFVKAVHEALLNYYQAHHPVVNWRSAVQLAREDMSIAKTWGELRCDARAVRLSVNKKNIELSASTAGWALVFPDYLLVTYPTLPAGRAGKLADEWANSLNPFYWHPSHFWHLPEQAYIAIEEEYGVRKKEKFNLKKYQNYITLRQQYCEYFCKAYNLSPDVLVPMDNKKRETLHIQSIFEVN